MLSWSVKCDTFPPLHFLPKPSAATEPLALGGLVTLFYILPLWQGRDAADCGKISPNFPGKFTT